jgi:hypothetical protein
MGGTPMQLHLERRVFLQNNLTVAQAATTGGNAFNMTGESSGSLSASVPNGDQAGAENTGFQTVTFAGAGSVNVTGLVADVRSQSAHPPSRDSAAWFRSAPPAAHRISGSANYTAATTIAGGTLILGKNAQSAVLTGPGALINSGLLALDYSGGGANPSGYCGFELTSNYPISRRPSLEPPMPSMQPRPSAGATPERRC